MVMLFSQNVSQIVSLAFGYYPNVNSVHNSDGGARTFQPVMHKLYV